VFHPIGLRFSQPPPEAVAVCFVSRLPPARDQYKPLSSESNQLSPLAQDHVPGATRGSGCSTAKYDSFRFMPHEKMGTISTTRSPFILTIPVTWACEREQIGLRCKCTCGLLPSIYGRDDLAVVLPFAFLSSLVTRYLKHFHATASARCGPISYCVIISEGGPLWVRSCTSATCPMK
jgi:hypothetical protein